MKINNINYSQNFGLKKTENYNLIEKSLIKSGQNKMVNLVPHAKLEYSHELKKFLLLKIRVKNSLDRILSKLSLPFLYSMRALLYLAEKHL